MGFFWVLIIWVIEVAVNTAVMMFTYVVWPILSLALRLLFGVAAAYPKAALAAVGSVAGIAVLV